MHQRFSSGDTKPGRSRLSGFLRDPKPLHGHKLPPMTGNLLCRQMHITHAAVQITSGSQLKGTGYGDRILKRLLPYRLIERIQPLHPAASRFEILIHVLSFLDFSTMSLGILTKIRPRTTPSSRIRLSPSIFRYWSISAPACSSVTPS